VKREVRPSRLRFRLFDIVNRLITKVLVTWPHGRVASSVINLQVSAKRAVFRSVIARSLVDPDGKRMSLAGFVSSLSVASL
jgi:hypothetical protein